MGVFKAFDGTFNHIVDTEKQFNLGASSKFASFFQNPANNFPSFALKILVLPASYARN